MKGQEVKIRVGKKTTMRRRSEICKKEKNEPYVNMGTLRPGNEGA